jgi:hypothetical protein
MLAAQLNKLVDTIEVAGWSIHDDLRPGIDRHSIEVRLQPLRITIPSELYELYEWHNGQGSEDKYERESLFDEHYFLSIESAISEYHQIVPAYQYPESLIDFTHCFPFAHFEGSYYAVYCNPQPFRGFTNPIIHIFEGVCICFTNLETMLQTQIEWYRSGAWTPESVDVKRTKQIRDDLNPGVALELL